MHPDDKRLLSAESIVESFYKALISDSNLPGQWQFSTAAMHLEQPVRAFICTPKAPKRTQHLPEKTVDHEVHFHNIHPLSNAIFNCAKEHTMRHVNARKSGVRPPNGDDRPLQASPQNHLFLPRREKAPKKQ